MNRKWLGMRLFFSLICCALLLAWPVGAVTPVDLSAPPKAAVPEETIDVTADQSLEWYQDKSLYLARGNAKAVRGSMTVEADILTAHARDKDEAAPPAPAGKAAQPAGGIDKLTAEGHVHITTPREQIFGEHGVYDLDAKSAKVTGDNLKYATEKDVVTAKDSLEYYEDKGVAIARGKAVAVHEGRHIAGDVLTAYFTAGDAQDSKELTRMTAEGNVVIVTATDVSRGDHGVYDVDKDTVTLTGHVRVTREGTHLSGDRAVVNFESGESRLLNDGSGRVHALLTPKTDAGKGDGKKTDSKKGVKP